jgi:hypothetical protein
MFFSFHGMLASNASNIPTHKILLELRTLSALKASVYSLNILAFSITMLLYDLHKAATFEVEMVGY